MALRILVTVVLVAVSSSCVTHRKDATGTGDERLNENAISSADAQPKATTDASGCGPEGKGNVVLLDARTASPVSCVLVTIARENPECVARCKMLAGESAPSVGASGTQCPDGTVCTSERIFNGRSNKVGQVNVESPGTGSLTAVAEGYAPTAFDPVPPKPNALIEIELVPDTGFLLKLVDDAGNYLPDLSATFKKGDEVLAQLRSNELANVYFPQRTPFSGETVTVVVDGYQPVQISSHADLGSDGHTLVLKK